ncbi:hypothetical protein ABKV19_021586 [Rosa sericea]
MLSEVRFEDALEAECPRMLNFNAPLLSTRRPRNSRSTRLHGRSLSASEERVPFSWEQAPGKSKYPNTSDDNHDGDTPRPKLPPGWWHWHKPLESTNVVVLDKENEQTLHDHDDGCDADVDDDVRAVDYNYVDDPDFDDEAFSDAIDVFSLSEAIDIVEKKAQREHDHSDALKLKLAESSEMNQLSPNYIIERFLPDAAALAASSAINLSVSQINSNQKLCYPWNYPEPEACVSRTVGQAHSSPRGCGFFPWRMKQYKLCGIKSPVVCSQQPQSSVKQKKHT